MLPIRSSLTYLLGLALAGTGGCASSFPRVRISEWERGIKIEARERPDMSMCLWFYEWNLFEAVQTGPHNHNEFSRFTHYVSTDGAAAEIHGEDMVLHAVAVRDGVDLQLTVTNRSNHDWPEVAGIIPCLNPGPMENRNPHLANTKTYFIAAQGLTRQKRREIHWNTDWRAQVEARSDNGEFVFGRKWPTSPVDATAGLMLRESNDGAWVTGIAWERFLSAQGHNPWECMHLCVRVGPLQQGESRTIRGKLYLFPGNRDHCLRAYERDFGPR